MQHIMQNMEQRFCDTVAKYVIPSLTTSYTAISVLT